MHYWYFNVNYDDDGDGDGGDDGLKTPANRRIRETNSFLLEIAGWIRTYNMRNAVHVKTELRQHPCSFCYSLSSAPHQNWPKASAHWETGGHHTFTATASSWSSKTVLSRDHEIMIHASSWIQLQRGLVQRSLIKKLYFLHTPTATNHHLE